MVLDKKRLGDILVAARKITPEDLQEALKIQRKRGEKLGKVLIDNRYITEEDLLTSLEEQLGVERVNLLDININKNVLKVLPENVCRKHNIFIFKISENIIHLAMSDPLNIFAIDDVEIITGFKVKRYITFEEQISVCIARYYSEENVLTVVNELEQTKEKEVEIVEEIDEIKNAPVVKLIDYVIKNAIENRVSDIHIEPYEKTVRVRYRIDGELTTISNISKDSSSALVTRIKIMANLNIAEKRIPQDGRIKMTHSNKEIDLRVSILPVIGGEKVVIRILNKDNFKMSRTNLGLTAYADKQLNSILKSPHGIILVTGPTGSGKSTTLYTILSELNDERKNIITVEDPVEYTLEGINQVNVNTKAGMTFASGLRSILRQDPDIVMIGEIRDSETAQIAMRAAITGHLVLSTLHTNDAPSSINRLIDMNIEPYLVSSAIVGVIAQRLVRKVCENCKEEYEASDYEKRILDHNLDEKLTLVKGKGCIQCANKGYKGRVGVYEIMQVSEELKNSIAENSNSELLKQLAINSGMKTLAINGKELVKAGITTIEEIMSISNIEI